MFGSTQMDAIDPSRLDGTGDCYFCGGLPWRGGHGWPVNALPPEGEVFSPCAAAALYRSDAFHAVGGFDERYFCYVEDVDLGFRLRLWGHRCVQIPAAIVDHVGGASSGGGNSPFARFQGTRNVIWCFVKNMPAGLLLPLLPVFAAVLLLLLAYGAKRGQAGIVAKAFVAAIRGLPEVWGDRRKVQQGRKATTATIANALSWSPRALARRAPVIRPLGRS
jgi:GT2 family glycosyltransferase